MVRSRQCKPLEHPARSSSPALVRQVKVVVVLRHVALRYVLATKFPRISPFGAAESFCAVLPQQCLADESYTLGNDLG